MSVYEYKYGFEVDEDRMLASALQIKYEIRMKKIRAQNSPNEILLEGAVQNYSTLQMIRAGYLKMWFQILNVVSILK